MRVAGPALHDHLMAAIQAYRQALDVRTRPDLPQDWAMTQNNLGSALAEQGTRTGGERGTQLLAEAVTAYRQALEVRTAEALPMGWAQTQRNLAKALLVLEDWPQAVLSYRQLLRMEPDDQEAYKAVSGLYHDKLFQFPAAFAVDQQWLERHPDDLSALSHFAEKHFTIGRFAACAQRLVALLDHPDVPPQIAMALRALEVATLLALEQTHVIPEKITTLQEKLRQQPETFALTWSFTGTLHFIHQYAPLAPYRAWLQQWFHVFTAPDRQSLVTGLEAARASFPAK